MSLRRYVLKNYSFCVLSAVLLILSFPKYNLEFLAWFGFVPLFFVLKGKSKGKAFLLSYITGVIFWSGTIYWLIHVTLPGTIIFVLYLALYFGFFGLLISYLLSTTYCLLFIPSAWVLFEYIRSHLFTGFPWALLGYSQYLNLSLIQIADITGVWGVSFLVMMINFASYEFITSPLAQVKKIKQIIPVIVCLIAVFIYGSNKISRLPDSAGRKPINVCVVQGNIPQELKWSALSCEYIIERYLSLTSLANKQGTDLIIWPEAALPVVLEEEPGYFNAVVKFTKGISTPLLLGAVTYRDDRYYNSALLISREGNLLARYDKIHLVPFGEYIPLRKILGFLEPIVPIGDMVAGKESTVFEITDSSGKSTVRFGTLICFEDLFPELSRRSVNSGAGLLVNITNDAWFGRTSSPYQHLSASVFRAVENRVFLVRAANTGVSGFISPDGKVISLVKDLQGENIFIPGDLTCQVYVHQKTKTIYTRYGDLFIFVCFLSILWTIVTFFKKQK